MFMCRLICHVIIQTNVATTGIVLLLLIPFFPPKYFLAIQDIFSGLSGKVFQDSKQQQNWKKLRFNEYIKSGRKLWLTFV